MVKRQELICGDCGGISEILPGMTDCEHCGYAPELTDDNTRAVETDEVEKAWYECESCGGEIPEYHKEAMFEEWPAGRARYIHGSPGSGKILDDDDRDPLAIWARIRGKLFRFMPRYVRPMSWHTPAMLSPFGWKSWAACVTQYIKANKGGFDEETGESLLQVFFNTVLGEEFEVEGEQPKINVLKQRVADYELRTVPVGGLLVVAFVDVQGDRLEFEADAFGSGEECWTIDHQVIHGDPRLSGPGSVWAELDKLRTRCYPHAGGQTLPIAALGVDSGYLTQDVYDWTRKWSHRSVIATKGDGTQGKPILGNAVLVDVNHRGKKIKNGARLFHIGVDAAKERFYGRLQLGIDSESGDVVEHDGPGFQHFPRGLPDEYFDQIGSEKLHRRKMRDTEVHEWIKTRDRNEALDLKIGCYAVAIYAGMQRINWEHRAGLINPAQRDIFQEAAKQDAAQQDGATPLPVAEIVIQETPAEPSRARERGRRRRRGVEAHV